MKNILGKNLLILASAGSGKTYQLSNRVLGLIAQGNAPESLVALTFTRKAAGEFGDEILKKLAGAAQDAEMAARLRADAQMPADVDFQSLLRQLVRAMPRMTLGTMDSFFARLILGFPYELGLTSGTFELVQGQKAEVLQRDLLSGMLRGKIKNEEAEAFLGGFTRANHGKQKVRVLDSVQEFVGSWQRELRAEGGTTHWGVPGVDEQVSGAIEEWETQREKLYAELDAEIAGTTYGKGGKRMDNFRVALQKIVATMAAHSTGSGHFKVDSKVAEGIISQVAENEGGDLALVYYNNEISLGAKASRLFVEIVSLMARAEVAAAIERTRGVQRVVRDFDRLCEEKLRKRGMLGFDEVKALMGNWRWDEESRLRREVVDYRLNARYAHWLLDEFQDTSQLEWQGIRPLIEEAVMAEGQSFFVVGDQKQGIYAWRGGEVGLFEEVGARYAMTRETMPESWRSCREVLALVNRVCGDRATMAELFGAELAAKWPWETHEAARKNLRGQARVTVVGKDETLAAMADTMTELGIGRRNLSCGVLLRTGKEVREVAQFLRAEGFSVLEEGVRKPGEDSAVGVALRYLVAWLANPVSDFEKKVIAMSPLAAVLERRYGEFWEKRWEGLLQEAEKFSYAEMLSGLLRELDGDLTDFGRQRGRDLLSAVADFEQQSRPSCAELADFLTGLEVSQEPGVAAVQVMTVHKSKGLGFDVVMLPKIPDARIPERQRFDRMRGEGWLCQAPVAWAREQFSALREVEAGWAAEQTYESFCLLYVALTRAKRGLYLFFEKKSRKKEDVNKPSLQHWVERACEGEEAEGVIFEEGEADWVSEVAERDAEVAQTEKPQLGRAVSLQKRRVASGGAASQKEAGALLADGDGSGARYGTEVHAEFEKIGVPDDLHLLTDTAAGRQVRACLEQPEIRALFAGEKGAEIRREQAFEVILDGAWLSGVIDRLVLWRDENGEVTRARVLDFKTDAVEDGQELRKRHARQMQAYRAAAAAIWPGCEVEVFLLSTHLREVVGMEE